MANFKIHARVLDLLGEEQIADCPTAISELFKNSFDAYATRVSLDIDIDRSVAVLWDDGIGMTEEDVLSRWLVVGTPGKKFNESLPKPPSGMSPRPIMGEKGIGRLAISTLGDTLLLITKRTVDQTPKYTALLINWNVVRNHHLLLADIEVPVIPFDDLSDLQSGIADDMVSSFLAPIRSKKNDHLWQGPYAQLRDKIIFELESFKFEFGLLADSALAKKPNGTLFYIGSIARDLPLYVAQPNRNDDDKDTPQALLVQLLGSFQQQFIGATPEALADINSSQKFTADVRVRYTISEHFRSVFDEWQTFNETDLSISDHHFKISFDEQGRYSGTIRRYDEIIELPEDKTRAGLGTSCGPFNLEFWYWQGESNATRLTAEQKALIDKKLPLFGGLLVYRDGLRVLPYGRPEFDWLKIEERRSLQAARAFFSYRRMFGFVSVSGEKNPHLRDKAGREGMKSNKEYRDFRKILVNFLTSIARQHFGESKDFKEVKAEVEAHQLALKKELNKVENQRKQLAQTLNEKIHSIHSGENEVKVLLNSSLEKLHKFANENSDEGIIQTNIEFENRISKIEERARFVIPSNVSLGRSSKLRTLKHDYEEAWPQFKTLCMSIRKDFSLAVKAEKPDVEMAALRKKTIENALFQARSKIGKAAAELRINFDTEVANLDSMLQLFKTRQLKAIESALLSSTFSETVDQALSSNFGDITLILGALEQLASDAEAEIRNFGTSLTQHLQDFSENGGPTLKAIQTDEIEALTAQVTQNLELVQLGLAVEIIDHDLSKLYRGIKTSISKLEKLWKDAPKSLKHLGELTANFQHLEQRYTLMSPLYRNSYRSKIDFNGQQIYDYLHSFLQHELNTHGVTLEASQEFIGCEFNESPARVLPVFINVVDNAVFWLREAAEKIVRLDRIENVITINDSGPGIHPSIAKDIFKPFVSEKPSGRGLGLHIARANLELAGHEIWAELNSPYRTMNGACICIRFNPITIKN